jgi:hypothetical protein
MRRVPRGDSLSGCYSERLGNGYPLHFPGFSSESSTLCGSATGGFVRCCIGTFHRKSTISEYPAILLRSWQHLMLLSYASYRVFVGTGHEVVVSAPVPPPPFFRLTRWTVKVRFCPASGALSSIVIVVEVILRTLIRRFELSSAL